MATTTPQIFNATKSKELFSFPSSGSFVINGFDPASDVFAIQQGYAVAVTQDGVTSTLILSEIPPANEDAAVTLQKPNIIVVGVSPSQLSAQNVVSGGRLASLENTSDVLAGSGSGQAIDGSTPGLSTSNVQVIEQTPNTGNNVALNTNNTGTVIERQPANTGTVIANSGNTVVEQTGTNIVRNPSQNTDVSTVNPSANTAERVNFLDGSSIFGTNRKDLGDIATNSTNGNTQETRKLLNTLGDADTVSVSSAGTYILGSGDDVANVQTAAGVINVMAGSGSDVVAISNERTDTNSSADTTGKTVNVLLGGGNQNGDGAADRVAIDMASLDSNTRVQITQWDTNDKIEFGNARLDYSVTMLKQGMIQANFVSADNGAIVTVTLNAADRAAFETSIGIAAANA